MGEIPSSNAIFTEHVRSGVRKIFPNQLKDIKDKIWEFEDYSTVALSDVDARTGGVALAAFLIMVFAYIPISYYVTNLLSLATWPGLSDYIVIASGLVAGFFGCVGVTRRFVGRIVNTYVRVLGRLIGKGF